MGYRIPDRYTWKELKSGVVVLDLESSDYYTLNETASTIWRGIVDEQSDDQIAAGLVEEFDCDAGQAKTDLAEQLDYFASEGILEKCG